MENKKTDLLIKRYLNGQASDEDLDELLTLLKESDTNRNHLASLANISSIYNTLTRPDSERDEVLAGLNERIRRETHKHRSRLWYAAAATAAAVMASLFIWNTQQRMPSEPEKEYHTYCNTEADVQAIILDDGSKVWLHSGSIIECDMSRTEERLVKLSGAAYFDVEKDCERPFIVKTEGIGVKVLGTTFSVETSLNGKFTTVLLESGSVRLQTLDGSDLVRLTPSQKAVYDAESHDIVISTEAATAYVVDRFNKVSLHDVTVDEILGHINKMYGAELYVSGPYDRTSTYTISYKRTDSVETVTDIVSSLTRTNIIQHK